MPPAAIIGSSMLVSSGLSYLGSRKAAKGARRAAATQAEAEMRGAEVAAQSQREALEYLKQREALPQYMREQALTRLGGVYGIQYAPPPQPAGVPQQQTVAPQQVGTQQQPMPPQQAGATSVEPTLMQRFANIPVFRGLAPIQEAAAASVPNIPTDQTVAAQPYNYLGDGGQVTGGQVAGSPFGQQDLIQQAMASPLYGAMMGGREAGEEAIMRQAAATGGLRSGNVQEAMYDYNTRLQNQALLQSYNEQLQGLRGLAGLPSYAPQIASGMAGIGQTLGAGISGAGETRALGQVAAGQAQQQGLQGISNIIGAGMGQIAGLPRTI